MQNNFKIKFLRESFKNSLRYHFGFKTVLGLTLLSYKALAPKNTNSNLGHLGLPCKTWTRFGCHIAPLILNCPKVLVKNLFGPPFPHFLIAIFLAGGPNLNALLRVWHVRIHNDVSRWPTVSNILIADQRRPYVSRCLPWKSLGWPIVLFLFWSNPSELNPKRTTLNYIGWPLARIEQQLPGIMWCPSGSSRSPPCSSS